MSKQVIWLTWLLVAALSAFIVIGAAHAYSGGCNKCYDLPGGGTVCTVMACGVPDSINAIDYSLLDTPKSDLQRCYRRCEKNNPPIPSPVPTASPVPMPCESIGSGSVKTFTVGEERRLCFTAGPGGPFVDVATQNHGNASCADFWMQMYGPTGGVSEISRGSQPGAVIQRTPGKYYLAMGLRSSTNTACSTLTFTVR